MAEITKGISATQAEFIRQELAASILFALPHPGAEDTEQYRAYERVRQFVHVIEMLEGKEPDWPSCEGCGKVFGLKEEHFTYSVEDHGNIDFCSVCNPGEANGLPAHDPRDADRDIERGRAFMAEFMSSGDDPEPASC